MYMTCIEKEELQRLIDYVFIGKGSTYDKIYRLKEMFRDLELSNRSIREAAPFVASWANKSISEVRRMLIR